MTGCVFCEIVVGERDAHLVYENEAAMAFLDKRPVFHGHTLVVPRQHHETILDLPDDALAPFFGAVRQVTGAVIEAMEAEGAFMAVNNKISQSVPHLHAHVVPRRYKDGLKGFFWPRHPYSSDQQAGEVADRIRRILASENGRRDGGITREDHGG